jgi:hypothetical protein
VSDSPGDQPSGRPEPGPGPALTPEDLQELEATLRRGHGDLTEAEADALDALDRLFLDPDDDDPADDTGPACDDGLDGDLEDGDPEDGGEGVVPDILDAGFTHRYATPGATGFRAGGPLDQMLPGADLAWHLGAARHRGLGELSDDELIGVLAAARRVQSWQAELELAAASELDARRAGPDGREGEHVDDELAAALTLTGRSAQALLELARQLERLPCTRALLAAGAIDRPRAAVIASHLSLLDDADAAAVDAAVAARAAAMTTGQLGQACHRAVIAHDPDAYQRRKKQAEQSARVECWAEASGTAAIAGRDLPRWVVVCGDKNLDADARWLAAHGADASHDQLRGAALSARLTGQRVRRPRSQPVPRPRRRDRVAERGQPHHAGHRLARADRPPGRDLRHRRGRAGRRRHLPPAGRRAGPQPQNPLVHHLDRPRRPRRRPRLRPGRTRTTRQRPTRLARHGHDHPDRDRHLRPSR